MKQIIEGVKSKCCDSDIYKIYNERQPGNEEEFICVACDKECDFYEKTTNFIKQELERWDELYGQNPYTPTTIASDEFEIRKEKLKNLFTQSLTNFAEELIRRGEEMGKLHLHNGIPSDGTKKETDCNECNFNSALTAYQELIKGLK